LAQVNWETPPRSDQSPRFAAPPEQVVGKPVGMNSPKVGVHVMCKANQQHGLKLSIAFNQLVKILLAVTRCK
jgi:hypothetical protein